MSPVSRSVKEKSWLWEKNPIWSIKLCHSWLEEVIDPLFLVHFSISQCVQGASKIFKKCVLRRNSNLAATGWKDIRKLVMTISNVYTGSQDRRQFFLRLEFEHLSRWVYANTKVHMKMFSAQKQNVIADYWIQCCTFFFSLPQPPLPIPHPLPLTPRWRR